MALNRAYQADESNQFDRYNEFSANQFSEEMDSNFSAGKLPVKQDARHHKKGRRPVLLSYLLEFWRSWVVLLAPLLLLPLPLATPDNVRQEMLVAYTILWMAAYWMTEALPLPITSMLPMVLLPLLGVQRTTEVAINYLNATNFMFVGGLMMAVAVEHCGLHQRIALNIISIVGTSQRKLMLGFMLTTMFLSMWISNTATVAMVVPIVDSVSAAIATSDAIDMEDTGTNNKKTHKAKDAKKGDEKTRNILLLACAYAANIGGTGVITGSPPNLVVLKQFAKVNTPLTFASWMGFAIPLMLVNVLIAWCWLQFLQWLATRGDLPPTEEQNQRVKRTIAEKKKNLGRISLHEIQVLLLFILLVCLWFFRKPKFIDGWGALFEQKDSSPGYVHSATPAILVIVLVYILPTKYNFWPFIKRGETPSSSPALLDWHTVEKNLPWGVIILLGGGFALAGASKSSGLSDLIGSGLEPLQVCIIYNLI
jgi:sodium-dependent dicarboxylate transporter 2/3/5